MASVRVCVLGPFILLRARDDLIYSARLEPEEEKSAANFNKGEDERE